LFFICPRCGYSTVTPVMKCPICGEIMHPEHKWRWGRFRGYDIWSFSPILPDIEAKISLGEAWTPLIRSSRLFRDIPVYFKDEGRNPTGSFRDRAAALIVSHAASLGEKRILLASDGNMGSSIAAYSARAGIRAYVAVPKRTDPEKILLMKAYGAHVKVLDKTIDELLDIIMRKVTEMKAYPGSTSHNPLSIEGLKTIGIEIYLQLGHVPRNIIVPLGSGITLYSIYHGFKEMYEHGIISSMPRLIGIESCGNPVYSRIFGIKYDCKEEAPPGLMYRDSPVKNKIAKILDRNDVLAVSKKESLRAAKLLARNEGLFVEPSSAVALAGLMKLSDQLRGDTVVILTGHGLKGPRAYSRPSRSKSEISVFPSSTKLMILEKIADNEPIHGYGLWKLLGVKISVQAVYQHLRELEKMGLIKSFVEQGVRKYMLTDKGKEVLTTIHRLS